MKSAPDVPKPAPAPGIRLLPLFLRNFVRNRETGLVLVAIVVGLLSGVLVAAISSLSQVSHALLFDIPFDAHLSDEAYGAAGVAGFPGLPRRLLDTVPAFDSPFAG